MPLFPKAEVLAVDLSADMVHLAKIHFPPCNYPNLDFRTAKEADLSDVEVGQAYDLITSFCVFHLVKEPRKLLQHLHAALAEKGRLVIGIPGNKNRYLFENAKEVFQRHGLEFPIQRMATGNLNIRDPEDACRLFEEEGYQLVTMDEGHRYFPCLDREEYIQWLLGTCTANWRLEEGVAEEILRELVEEVFCKHPELAFEDGSVLNTATVVTYVLEKSI